jgi:hypothetical protein
MPGWQAKAKTLLGWYWEDREPEGGRPVHAGGFFFRLLIAPLRSATTSLLFALLELRNNRGAYARRRRRGYPGSVPDPARIDRHISQRAKSSGVWSGPSYPS